MEPRALAWWIIIAVMSTVNCVLAAAVYFR